MTLPAGRLVWPDVVALTVGWLRADIPGLIVEETMPLAVPTPIVIVQRSGGIRQSLIDVARITFEGWAQQADAAADLILSVRDSMLRFPGLRGGFHVHRTDESAGPARSVDSDTGLAVYLLTVDARIRPNAA